MKLFLVRHISGHERIEDQRSVFDSVIGSAEEYGALLDFVRTCHKDDTVTIGRHFYMCVQEPVGQVDFDFYGALRQLLRTAEGIASSGRVPSHEIVNTQRWIGDLFLKTGSLQHDIEQAIDDIGRRHMQVLGGKQ